jgi:ATP phosphoribosyltransferase
MPDRLTIAVSKGRILEEALPLLARTGIEPVEDPEKSRKLVLETGTDGVRLLIIRATDVPTYVEHGAADVGIAGKDVLLEYDSGELYEPLDLGIARCRLMLAGPVGDTRGVHDRMRIATKYVNVTRRYFSERGLQVEIIKLYGSMELAPVLGLAERIVDLVDTGHTLKANGLEPIETITEISSRLIVNKAALKIKSSRVKPLIRQLAQLTGHTT